MLEARAKLSSEIFMMYGISSSFGLVRLSLLLFGPLYD